MPVGRACRAWNRGVEPGRGALRGPLLVGEVRVRTAADVLAVIEGQVGAVLADLGLGTVEKRDAQRPRC